MVQQSVVGSEFYHISSTYTFARSDGGRKNIKYNLVYLLRLCCTDIKQLKLVAFFPTDKAATLGFFS